VKPEEKRGANIERIFVMRAETGVETLEADQAVAKQIANFVRRDAQRDANIETKPVAVLTAVIM
jgi:hypothetical protein